MICQIYPEQHHVRWLEYSFLCLLTFSFLFIVFSADPLFRFLHHSLQVQCLWSFSLKSPLFFSMLPYFVVYCCGPIRLRSKHSWSLGYPLPLLLHLWPSCFCWTFLWCSPPLLKLFLTVSSVLIYLLSKCHRCYNFNVWFHLILLGVTVRLWNTSLLLIIFICLPLFRTHMLQVKETLKAMLCPYFFYKENALYVYGDGFAGVHGPLDVIEWVENGHRMWSEDVGKWAKVYRRISFSVTDEWQVKIRYEARPCDMYQPIFRLFDMQRSIVMECMFPCGPDVTAQFRNLRAECMLPLAILWTGWAI